MESMFGLASAQQTRMPTEPIGQSDLSGQAEGEEAPEETFEATIIRLDHAAAEALFHRAWLAPM
jgi:hypothetical protein